jgi:hypothetical protein
MDSLVPVRILNPEIVNKPEDFDIFTERYSILWRSVMRYHTDTGRIDGNSFYLMEINGHTLRLDILKMRSSVLDNTYMSLTLDDEFTLSVGDIDISHLRAIMRKHIGNAKQNNVLSPDDIVQELVEFADDYYGSAE